MKTIVILVLISIASMVLVDMITKHLDTKPKTNKFRQWWSNNVCDLDNRF